VLGFALLAFRLFDPNGRLVLSLRLGDGGCIYSADGRVESAAYENDHPEEELVYIHDENDGDSDWWWFHKCAKEGAISGGRDRGALWS